MSLRIEQNAGEIEGPKMISDALGRYFYFGNTKIIMSWFGFFQSSLHSTVYFMFMAPFLFGVVNFQIYKEFEGKKKAMAVYCAGTPFLFLFLSNMVSKLTFTLTRNGTRDKLTSFLMIDDSGNGVEQNVVHVRYFRREYSSQLLKFRVFIGGFGLFLVLFKVIADICRLSKHASTFHSICNVALWCYMCLSSVIANGFLYMVAISCKLHVIIFKNRLNEPGNSSMVLLAHHRRLSEFIEDFSRNFSWYFTSQAIMCQTAGLMATQLMYVAYKEGHGFFIPADFICFLVVETPMFWSIRRVLHSILSEFETIGTIVAEKSESFSLISTNEELKSFWEFVADHIKHFSKGAEVFGSTSRILFLALLPLGIATIFTLGKLTGYIP